jgi:hypothetical protein
MGGDPTSGILVANSGSSVGHVTVVKEGPCPSGCDDECRKEIKEYSEGKARESGGHTASDIANATIAVFGEMTPGGAAPDKEAAAITSCIFNRKKDVDDLRARSKELDKDAKLDKEIADIDAEIARIRARERTLRTKEEQADLGREYRAAVRKREAKVGQRLKARAETGQRATEFLGSKDADSTLTNVVTSGKNFGGHQKGMGYVTDVLECKIDRNVSGQKTRGEMACKELKSYCKRWRAAKAAVDAAAADGPATDYRYMFSNWNGKRNQDATDVRIDGNDFSQTPMREHR